MSVCAFLARSESQRASESGQGSRFVGGKAAAQHILSPNATRFAPQITARTNQFTSISYGAPEKRLLFPPNRTNSTLLTCLFSPAAQRIHFGNGGRREGSPGRFEAATVFSERGGCQQTNGAFLLHVQVLGAYRCPGHINQFPTRSLELGFALTVDILGPVMPDAIFFLLEPSREAC